MLANLVASRLSAESESVLSLASQIAVDSVALMTKRQMKLLALCSFIEEIRPKTPVDDYCIWLNAFLNKFEDLEFYKIDAMHLTALSCITFDPTSERDLELLLGLKIGKPGIENIISSSNFGWLHYLWNEGLAGVALTSVCSLIGAFSFDKITGSQSGRPSWSNI